MPVKRKLAKNKSKGRAYGTAGIQQSSRRTRRTMAKEINAGLQIIYRKLSEMHPNPKNPRKQGDDGIVPLAESIEANPQFFEARPILLSDRTGKLVIIGGERRWEAAQYLEMETAPSILFHGLTEEQEDEIMTRDNTHAGVWDEAKLKAWPNDLLEKWGAPKWNEVTEKDLAGLFEKHEAKPKPNFIVVEVPAHLGVDIIRKRITDAIKEFSGVKIK